MEPNRKVRLHAQPFLRWAGSKRQLVEKLASYWNDEYKRYIEPFAGSAVLYYRLLPASAILSDKNGELIHAMNTIRAHPEAVYESVIKLKPRKRDYYAIRAQSPSSLKPIPRAARFLFLNRYCFNGLYRTNSRGEFNVPFSGLRKVGKLPCFEDFLKSARALEGVDIRACDFGSTLRRVRRGDFVYLDPPYAVQARRVFREYGAATFSNRDLIRLSEHLKTINSKGASFLLSYADCAEARTIFSTWDMKRIRVKRHVAGFSGARRHAFELIFTNNG